MDVEARNETRSEKAEGSTELPGKQTDDNSERADSGMDEDSQHSNSNDAKSHGELESSDDDEDVVQRSRKKIHRLLDDDLDSEDSRPPPDVSEESDIKTVAALKSAEAVLDTIFKEDEDSKAEGSSDSDDDVTLLNTIKNKKKVVDEDSDGGTFSKETEAHSEGTMFGNGDLFDADDSEDGRNSENDSAKDSSSDTDDEGFDESKIDPKLLKQLKKGAAKKDPSQTARGKRKAKEEALLSMHSETQRIVREGRVQLPYHNPAPRPLTDFLGRAMRKQEQYKALKGSKSLQKVRAVHEVIEKAKFTPKNKSATDESLIQNSSDSQKETCVDTIQQPESQKETESDMIENIELLPQKRSDQTNIPSSVQSDVEGSDQTMTVDGGDGDNDSLPDLDDKVDQPVVPADSGVESNVTTSSVIDTVGVNVCEPNRDDTSMMSNEGATCVSDCEMADLTCTEMKQTDVDQQINKEGAKTEFTDCATEIKSQTVSSETSAIEQPGDLLDQAETSKATILRELMPELPSLSKMTGDPNFVIDLEDEAECTPRNPGVQKLMDRFLKHSKKKEKKVCSDVDISIVQKESGDSNKQELKESTFTYHVTQEEANPLKELAAPGAKLTALKSQLQVKMKARREEARQKRQEVYDLDNEEGYEAEDEVLDDEAELTDQSDTDDEEIDEFEEQFGEEEEEIEADERKEKNPFMDEEADEDDEGDEADDDDDLNLRLDSSDGEDAQQSDNDEVDRALSAKKKPKVLQISDDEEESRDVIEKADQNTGDKVEKQIPMESTADESLEEDAFSPFSKHLSSMVNTQKESLSLPIEDSQDLYGTSQSIPATTVVTQTQSHGIHFFMDDSQSQMLDADGFLKMGSSTKKPKKFDFAEANGTQDNMEELLGLCSGRFAGTQAEGKKVSCKSLFGTQNVNSTQGNMEELLGLCSGRFVSSNKEDLSHTQSSKKRKSPLDEEEENEKGNPDDEFEIASNDENVEESDKEELSGDEKGEVDDDDDDNMDEIDGDASAPRVFSGFTVKNKHGKIRQEFVDEEAELSGSEYDSDENLDLALEDDIMELEEGDKDVLVSDDELRNQVGRAHLKQIIDEDKRELMRFQEMYLPDGDLHSEGGGRVRKFRWKNIDDDTQQDMFGDDSDGEKEEEEGENDFKWRKERFEREKWLQEQQENEKIEDGDSQLVKFGKVFLKRRDSDSGAVPAVKKTPLEAEKQNTKKETPSTPTNFYKLSKQKRGSFLSRDKDTLAKIAEMSKPANINLKGARNSRNFVFQVISPDKGKSQQQVGLTPTIGPKIRKAHSAKPSQKPAAKKPRLENKSFSQNSIFHHM